MEEDFRTLVLSLVPGTVAARVHWAERPQGAALPAVVMYDVSRVEQYTQKAADNLVMQRVQVDCVALTYAAAKSIERALLAGLSGFRGVVGGTDFQGVFLDGARGTSEKDDAQRMIFTQSVDFMINHKET